MADTIWWPDLAGDHVKKTQGLKVSIRGAIASGRIGVGARLPPVREVAWRLGITPGTVAKAYKDLVDDGVLEAVVGRGTFVATEAAPVAPPVHAGFLERLPEGMVNLRSAEVADVGQADAFREAMRALPPAGPGDYVGYPLTGFDITLRRHIADWFAAPAHGEIAAEDVVLTQGGQHALVILMQTLLHGPRPVVLTEELAYPGIRHAAALVRADIAGVPMDDEGLLPDALDRAATETGAQLLCTSAEAHNPTTVRTSDERRARIVAVARAHGMQIVDDNCFCPAGAAAPGYRTLAPERSWLAVSLSKNLSPDIRVGAIVAPPGGSAAVRQVAQQQFFGLARPLVEVVTAIMESGRAAGLRDAIQAASGRRVAMAREALAGWDAAIRDDVPFVWLRMPRGWRASSFLRAAEAAGIRLKAADEFALIDGRAPNAVRLTLTSEQDDGRFRAALDRLAGLLAQPPLEVDV
ncbi:PLP-dependent aminotransferase family protein [Wenxinia marina]|uniref:aminotransferase-like domain-containing protein n=1 Tax=Wenxinia marina TaxID=390641 RepID=UPI000366199E|nr:PLP-dependent aminotransferase family protein [Wenxinia marina]